MAAPAARIAEVLAGLRASSARLRTAAGLETQFLSAGVPSLDAALGGGLARGRVTELVGARSSGRLSLVLSALGAAQATGELAALVDVADGFDARSGDCAGVQLARLLWVRPRTLVDGLRAADRVLDAGGFGLVVLYLCGVSTRVRGEAAWARLAHRAERARAVLLVVGDRAQAGSFAAATLQARSARRRWVGQGSGRLLAGSDGEVAILRSKLGVPGEPAQLELELAG